VQTDVYRHENGYAHATGRQLLNVARAVSPSHPPGPRRLFRGPVQREICPLLPAIRRRAAAACPPIGILDSELKVKFKLLGDRAKANGGVQFRTKRIPNDHEVIGYQADIGQQYWGALYDESRRKKVLAGPTRDVMEKIVKFDDWNDYTIRCEGPRIRLWLNGTLTVDYTEPDDKIERTGIIGLQIHGGAKAKALYKDIVIEELKGEK